MYSSVTACVRHNSCTTYVCASHQGVKQGEPLSPIMFLLFVNDMKNRLKEADNFVSFSDLKLFALLYADDTVLFAESPDALHTLLVTGYHCEYCQR
jgi:hypothetical protein